MKDFYDLFALSRRFAFDGPVLAAAIRATFTRRGTDLAALPPVALTDEFAEDVRKQAEWQGFLKRGKLDVAGVTLETVVAELRVFLLPLADALNEGVGFDRHWTPADHRWSPPPPR